MRRSSLATRIANNRARELRRAEREDLLRVVGGLEAQPGAHDMEHMIEPDAPHEPQGGRV